MGNTIEKRLSATRTSLSSYRIDTLLVLIEENRRYLSGYTGEDNGFDVRKPQATFYCYVKCPVGTASGERFGTATEFSEFLIREALISTVPWDDAGKYVRFSVTFEAESPDEETMIIGEMKERMGRLQLQMQ